MNRQPDDSADLDQTTDLPVGPPAHQTPPPKLDTERLHEPPIDARLERAAHPQDQDTAAETNDPAPTCDFDVAAQTITQPTQTPKTGFPNIPGYEILAELGRGGMGVVYSARHIALDRVVALKMILSGHLASPEAILRFDAEARAVARLEHPNIVRIHDIGVYQPDGDTALRYFSLEFVAGESLAKRIGREPQSPPFAAQTVLVLAQAMQYAHERNIIHRDLKPANVLLATDGTVKLTDFGVAKRLDEDSGQTQSGQIVGTPSFMSPEQANGAVDQLSAASDVYSLGAILYDMLTGRPPFVGTGVMNTLEMVRKQEPIAPGLLVNVPRDLETICLKCLHKDPARRYATAAALADDLQRFLDGRPIAARPVGRVEKTWRWAKRNPWVAGLSASVGVLVLAIISITSVMLYRLSMKNDQLNLAYREENAAKEKALREERRAKAALASEQLANERTNAALQTTAEQRQLGLEALHGMLVRVDNVYRHDIRFSKHRLEIINRVLIDLDKFRDNANAHPLEGRNEAIAYQRLSELYNRSKRLSDALEWVRKARALAMKHHEVNPTDMLLLHNAAGITHDCATLEWSAGNGKVARDLHAEALALRQKRLAMVQQNGTEAQIATAWYALADSHGLLAFTDLRLGEPKRAYEGYLESRKLFTTIPGAAGKARTTSFFGRRVLSEVEIRLGDCQARLGQPAVARRHYETALSHREELVRLTPKPPQFALLAQADFAQAQLALADFELIFENAPVAATVGYSQALATFEALRQQEPDNYDLQQGIAALQYRLGYVSGRRPAFAILGGGTTESFSSAFFEASLKTRAELAKGDPNDLQAQVEWFLALARLNRANEAQSIAERLLKQGGHDRQILFQIACGYAILGNDADGAEYRTKALVVLKQLVDKGWQDRITLQTDPDLESLRSDERLKALLK